MRQPVCCVPDRGRALRSWRDDPRRLLRPYRGAVALRGLTALAGNPRAQGFTDIRDATAETVALTLGLIAGAVPAAAIAVHRRRARPPGPTVSGLA
jgi:hypothetical protein